MLPGSGHCGLSRSSPGLALCDPALALLPGPAPCGPAPASLPGLTWPSSGPIVACPSPTPCGSAPAVLLVRHGSNHVSWSGGCGSSRFGPTHSGPALLDEKVDGHARRT
ncbi:hypothetical protein R1flu_023126 [Riccia fluitans]|uniref:Uncharacterized protein n=1 Tax=Riccia fluitans TaxID=41844 RepID=A0ABD1XR54_9MARC